ncbi:hypothetical protein ABZ714_18825 [Streptomyces sp. NPDC006798]|uniref:hypothetical protein n=1 Tax=Streptomyces sp. NPDC006798 TaxID=3155462 RepID=UPI003406D816
MTTADAVRARLGPGRLLPLGRADGGAWLTEQAAGTVLARAAAGIGGVRPGRIRLWLADPATALPAAVPAPPSALPYGPLRIEADFAADGAILARRSLAALGDAVRGALLTTARDVLDLEIAEVGLRLTDVLDEPVEPDGGPEAVPPSGSPGNAADPVAVAVAEVAGVAGLTGVLGEPVHREHDGIRVECAVAAGHRPLAVVRAVRAAARQALEADRPVSVLVTAVEPAAPGTH